MKSVSGVAVGALALAACLGREPAAPAAPAATPAARSFEDAESLFRREPRWLGGDAALSIPLGADRTLWLFGDSFVATTAALRRDESVMVRNSIAIQTGADPRAAAMAFHWREEAGGTPASFFPEAGDRWHWPGHGMRLAEGSLVAFLYMVERTPGRGLGFATDGYAVAVIDDPDAPPDAWRPRLVPGPRAAFDAVPATAVVREGEHVVALAIRQEGTHEGALVRWRARDLARGDPRGAEWWAGSRRGWVGAAGLGEGGPTFVLDDAGAECSIHFDSFARRYVHVASYGFGATTIGVRTAPALTGPWSAPRMVYRPPESDGPRPFVYAAKAHPELRGPDRRDLVVTYATNSFEFGDLFTERGARALYWPRFVVVRVPE